MTVIWILYVHSIQVRETDNMKKTQLIKKHGSIVMAMMQATPQTRRYLVKDSPSEVIRCVSECCHNVLKGNVHLSSAQKKKLYPSRQHLRRLASKSISVKKKKQILNQKGGFLSLLAPALLPLLGKAVSGGIGGALKSL